MSHYQKQKQKADHSKWPVNVMVYNDNADLFITGKPESQKLKFYVENKHNIAFTLIEIPKKMWED